MPKNNIASDQQKRRILHLQLNRLRLDRIKSITSWHERDFIIDKLKHIEQWLNKESEYIEDAYNVLGKEFRWIPDYFIREAMSEDGVFFICASTKDTVSFFDVYSNDCVNIKLPKKPKDKNELVLERKISNGVLFFVVNVPLFPPYSEMDITQGMIWRFVRDSKLHSNYANALID